MFELQCPEWLWPLSSPCLDALNSHWHCDDHPKFKVWENIKSSLVFWVFLSALKFYFEFECHGSQSTVNPTCSRKLRYGTPHHPMMFSKDLGKQHVWRKVIIWYTRPMFFRLPANLNTPCFFLRKVCWDHLGVLVVWCHLWGLMFQDKRQVVALSFKTFLPLKVSEAKLCTQTCLAHLDPITGVVFFFPSLAQGSPQGSPGHEKSGGVTRGRPVPAMLGSLQPVGGPQNQPLGFTRSFLFSVLKGNQFLKKTTGWWNRYSN